MIVSMSVVNLPGVEAQDTMSVNDQQLGFQLDELSQGVQSFMHGHAICAILCY